MWIVLSAQEVMRIFYLWLPFLLDWCNRGLICILTIQGIKYGSNDKLIGFSHTHMTGGGCSDYKGIMFFPLNKEELLETDDFPAQVQGAFSHDQEVAQPGYYNVKLLDSGWARLNPMAVKALV
jgi:hypothetical protein